MSSPEQSGKPTPMLRTASLSVFLSLGLRPFFLGAASFAIVAIGLWVLALRGTGLIDPGYGMAMWHVHEMLFGYGPAVLTGFLLTAVPNWTGRRPLSGAGLGILWLLWLGGRIVMMAAVPPFAMIALDAAFLPVVAIVMAREIISAQNFRNLVVLGPIVVFALANAVFHIEAAHYGTSEYGVRLGIAALMLLLMLIGGRIVPAFTRNWLVREGSPRRPTAFNRFDGALLLVSLAALALWVLVPQGFVTAGLLGLSAVLHVARLSRWGGWSARHDPLLFVLHAAYAMIPVGLMLTALGAGTGTAAIEVAALHLLGIGAVGGMTMSVMIRASLGHTGQALRADFWINIALVLIFASACARVVAEFSPDSPIWIDLSGGMWMVGFALFILRIGPSLLTPRPKQGLA